MKFLKRKEGFFVNNIELVDPKYDFVFKMLFGSDPEIFISFVNSVLNLEESKAIVDVTFINPELHKEAEDDKAIRLDVLAKLADGDLINIEMQMQNHGHYIKRSLYYWSKVYHSQLKQGENYDTLKKTIAIHVLNFSLFKHSKHYHTEAVVMDAENKVQLTDMFSIHYLDLAKLPSGNYNTLEKWLRFLKQPSKEEVLQMNIPAITKAYKQLENMSLDSGIRARYDAKRKFEHDYVTGLDTAKDEGREEGRKEEKINVVKNLFLAGVSIDIIQTATGLSLAEIHRIQQELNLK